MSGLSNRLSLLRQRGFAYPAGWTPGFDPSHVAMSGALNGLTTSLIAAQGSNGGINVLTGVRSTYAPSTKATQIIDGALGPCQKFVSSLTSQIFIPQTPPTISGNTQGTLACIYRPTGLGVITQGLVNLFNGDAVQGNANACIFLDATGHLKFGHGNPGSTGNSSGILLTANHPYFLAASAIATSGGTGPLNFIVVDLSNGAVFTSSTTNTFTGAGMLNYVSVNGGLGVGDNWAANSTPGNFAAAMFSFAFLSIPQLLQWGKDPWSFWYPSQIDPAMMLTIPSAAPAGQGMMMGWWPGLG